MLGRLRRCGRFVADLFKGPNNQYWDLGRIIVGSAASLMGLAVLWNVHLGQPISLSELGGGLSAVIGAGAALIAAKDIARTKHPPSKGTE